MEKASGFIAKCRERGLKLTPQRLAIHKILAAKAQHPTINEVYERIKKDYPSLSLNTVYKTLQLFIELGMASQFTTKEGVIRYEIKIQPHHHILCLKCRRINDIFDSSLDKLKVSPPLKGGFEIIRHDVIFYGYCSECKQEGR
ncbi:MAG: Fur family transcriptional regulator [Nitrospirota bacterium]|jgi:Fur family peroxide stress response transcriptional regulator